MRHFREKLESFAEVKRVRYRRRIAAIDRRLESEHAVSADIDHPSGIAEPAAEVTGAHLEIQLLLELPRDNRMVTALGHDPLGHPPDPPQPPHPSVPHSLA